MHEISNSKFNSCYVKQCLLLCNLLLATCSAVILELPLKKYRRAAEYDDDNGSGRFLRGNQEVNYISNHRWERSLRSEMSLQGTDLDGMVDNLKGESGEGYYTNINIGSPPQKMQVLIDTGSSNFAVACQQTANISDFFHRDKSTTYSEDGAEITVAYTEGSWNGILGSDLAALTSAPNLSSKVNIVCITESADFYTSASLWQGILGMAYSKLARPDPSVSPFWDSLQSSHPNMSDVFSIQLCGSSFVHSHQKPLKQGSLILGGVLPKLAKSDFFYTPVYKEWYYEVILTDIQVQRESLNLDCKEYNMDKTIVDSGTTSIRLPIKVFRAVQQRILENIMLNPAVVMPHQAFFDGIDLLCYFDIGLAFSAFPVISFHLMSSENASFRMDLTPQHYLRPVSNFADMTANHSCVKYGFLQSNTGTVLGAIFMEAFYTVFDRENRRIGFAQTSCPLPDPNNKLLDVTIQGPYPSNQNLLQCAFKKPEASGESYLKVTYILLAFSLIIFIPLFLFAVFRIRKSRVCRTNSHYQQHRDERTHALSMSAGDGNDER